MKKNDITLVVVISIVSAVFALLLSNLLIGTPESQSQNAEVVKEISSEFNPPDDTYFNSESINPTQLIRIGDEQGNQAPFNQTEQ